MMKIVHSYVISEEKNTFPWNINSLWIPKLRELKSIKESLSECIGDLSKNQKDLEKAQNEIKGLEAKRVKISETRTPKKKYVQTSLFEPLSSKENLKDLLHIINEIDINSDTPEKIKEQLKELTRKIEKLS